MTLLNRDETPRPSWRGALFDESFLFKEGLQVLPISIEGFFKGGCGFII
jgi:hypothetical protein